MVSINDPVESFFNSLNAVKEMFSPLECGIQKAVKDFEACWAGPRNEIKKMDIFSQFDVCVDNWNVGVRSFDVCVDNWNVRVRSVKKKQCKEVLNDERKKGSGIRVPLKAFWGNLFHHSDSSCGRNVENLKSGTKGNDFRKEEGSCVNCMQFSVTWSLFVNGFVQAFSSPFKTGKKRNQKICGHGNTELLMGLSSKLNKREFKDSELTPEFHNSAKACKEGDVLSLELFLGFVCDQVIQNLPKFDQGSQKSYQKNEQKPDPPSPAPPFDHFGVVYAILKGRKEDVNSFLGNLKFARVGGTPSSLVGVTPTKDENEEAVSIANKEESENISSQKAPNSLLNIPLSNVERLCSTLSGVSLTELIELVPQLGRSSQEYPDKKKLISVQDFFRYTESEGRRFFEELDRDGDGQVTLEDLEIAMRKRKLPRRYAREFMRRTRRHLFSKSFGWKQFLSIMEQKEPTILRAYTTLCLSKSGTLQKSQVVTSLKNAGLPANDDNAVAMMRFLDADTKGSISYGHFRNFMLLLPSDRLQDDPRSIWFEAATVVAVAPPVEIPAGSVLKSALAGGLASALSTSVLHPVDTIKTRVQSSTLSFPELVSKLPEIGVQGLYRGCIPAILGQFSSHGLRTGIFEASKLVLINVAPALPEFQVQSIASFCSTILGTAVRIPCEVLKQRLQAGIFDNVGEAIVGTMRQDGLKGFFRGTGATLCREVPFYVAGMGLYAESKKAAQQLLRRELEPWETIAVGAFSGGLAAVVTTPFDVMKTRMMTAPQGRSVSMLMVVFSILHQEGPLGLFKGAIPRFFWIAPLGAMNFAGYELAKKAMVKSDEESADLLHKKALTNTG